jgi:simple sugar transport system permease protein
LKEQVQDVLKDFGLPRLIISGFLLFILLVALGTDLDVPGLLSDSLVRIGMNGLFVLAMVPTIQAGVGLNFGLPVGIICGIVGCLVSMELAYTGFLGFFTAVIIAVPLGILAGFLYAQLLNRVVGQEMMVGTYVGFSIVAGMCIFWLLAPFKNPTMIWAIGGSGLRVTLTLADSFAGVLNEFLSFTIFGVTIPTGLLLFFALGAFSVWLFFRTKTGVAMEVVGRNPRFAVASGLNLNKYRTMGVIYSTILGAVGYVVYAQSFGFVQLYMAPLMMAFPAVAGILIGGASTNEAKVVHAVIGVVLFQTLLTTAMPVTNKVIQGNISEIARVIVSNGMILYALTRTTGGEKA